jgi:uncharacterized protein YecT (DUF1311 family)
MLLVATCQIGCKTTGFVGLLALLTAALPALAQNSSPSDCKKPATQIDMTICATQDYDKADAGLNAQYKLTKQKLADLDKQLADKLKGAEKSLLTAQRAWIAYRDAQCAAYGFQARGGTLEPMLISGCLAEMTRKRTQELKQLAEGL